MSDIRAGTISDAAGTGPITMTKQSPAKAWANLNGTSFGLRGSFNISSASDQGVGQYKFNYSTNMGNVNYSAYFSAGQTTGTTTSTIFIGGPNGSALLVGSTFCNVVNASAVQNMDRDQVFFLTHGDLA